MTTPSPSALIESARAQPVHSPARTNYLLEAIAVALAATPAPRARASQQTRKPEAATKPDA